MPERVQLPPSMKNVDRVVLLADYFINPADILHDLDHHKNVEQNCMDIVKSEGLLGVVDIDALHIIPRWHDVLRENQKQNNSCLSLVMHQVGYSKKYIEKILEIANSHSFDETDPLGLKHQSLEAKIIYDGDKIEYVSLDRTRKVSSSLQSGEMSADEFNELSAEFKKRIPHIIHSLHFTTSCEILTARINILKAAFADDPRFTEVFNSLDQTSRSTMY